MMLGLAESFRDLFLLGSENLLAYRRESLLGVGDGRKIGRVKR